MARGDGYWMLEADGLAVRANICRDGGDLVMANRHSGQAHRISDETTRQLDIGQARDIVQRALAVGSVEVEASLGRLS